MNRELKKKKNKHNFYENWQYRDKPTIKNIMYVKKPDDDCDIDKKKRQNEGLN